MYWHIDTDIVSLIIVAALYVYSRKVAAQSDAFLCNRRFMRCLLVGVVVTAVDVAASVIMEVPTTRFLYHLLMTLYFACIEIVIVEWFLYVLAILFQPNERGERAIRHTVVVIYALYAAFVCLNPWTGLIYRLGPSNEYERGPFFALMIILFALYTLALFLLVLIRWRHIPKGYPSGILIATPVVIAIGLTVQLLTPGYLLVMPAYIICLVLAFLFLQNLHQENSRQLVEDLSRVAETDLLTGLYNRTGMEFMVQKTLDEAYGQGVLVVIADIDDLKHINDTYGHAGGDRAIRMVAAQLKRHFRACDTVVRYGGDEFLVFLTGPFTEDQLRHSIERLVYEIGLLQIADKAVVGVEEYLHGSVGAAYGVVGRDSFESLCNKADAALYYVKRNGKNACAFYRPEMETEPFMRKRDTVDEE